MKNVSDISPRYVGTEELAVRTTTVPEVALNDATVLVVEDNGDVREYIVSTLARLGYRALEAGEASAALTVIEHHPEVNLLLTDVGLPGLNGRRLAEEASRRLPGIKILFVTGYARDAIVHHGVLEEGVELLSKPFTIGNLAGKINQIFAGAPF